MFEGPLCKDACQVESRFPPLQLKMDPGKAHHLLRNVLVFHPSLDSGKRQILQTLLVLSRGWGNIPDASPMVSLEGIGSFLSPGPCPERQQEKQGGA